MATPPDAGQALLPLAFFYTAHLVHQSPPGILISEWDYSDSLLTILTASIITTHPQYYFLNTAYRMVKKNPSYYIIL